MSKRRAEPGRAAAKRPALPRPRVYIPSSGRCCKRNGTVNFFFNEGYRATVVVEPHEATEYREWVGDKMDLLVLAEEGQGVGYARNAIMEDAPEDQWFWIIDDDITSFHERVGYGDVDVSVEKTMQLVLTDPKIVENESIAIVGLEYEAFATRRSPTESHRYILNSYCNVVCAYNKARLPAGIRFHFKVREDFDFALQVILCGKQTLRFKFKFFSAPAMGTVKGGMHQYYFGEQRSQIAHTVLFHAKWGSLVRRCQKGINSGGDITNAYLPNIKVLWQSVHKKLGQQRMEHAKIRASRNGVPHVVEAGAHVAAEDADSSSVSDSHFSFE